MEIHLKGGKSSLYHKNTVERSVRAFTRHHLEENDAVVHGLTLDKRIRCPCVMVGTARRMDMFFL